MVDSATTRLVLRRAVVLLVAALMAISPAGALAMGHCPAMSAACQGPCASYACAAPPVSLVQAPVAVGDLIPSRVARVPTAVPGTPDPPPRYLPLSS